MKHKFIVSYQVYFKVGRCLEKLQFITILSLDIKYTVFVLQRQLWINKIYPLQVLYVCTLSMKSIILDTLFYFYPLNIQLIDINKIKNSLAFCGTSAENKIKSMFVFFVFGSVRSSRSHNLRSSVRFKFVQSSGLRSLLAL